MEKEKELANVELKPLVRKRDKYICIFCKRDIRTVKAGNDLGSNSVHHKVPLRHGGKNIPSNCITICATCHYTLENLINIVERRIIKLNEKKNK